jgi:hypothetical protein
VRFDFARLVGKHIGAARKLDGAAIGGLVEKPRVRIGDRGQLEIFVDALATLVVRRDEFDDHLGAVRPIHFDGVVADDVGPVLLGIDREAVAVGGGAGSGAADDAHGFAGGDQTVHARRR